jgi:flagellar protein FliT
VDQKTLIERLLELTLASQHAATMADWPEAARLTQERSVLFRLLTREQDEAGLATIRKIQAIDAAIAAEAGTAQVELRAEYNVAMGNVQAVSKYHQAARF